MGLTCGAKCEGRDEVQGELPLPILCFHENGVGCWACIHIFPKVSRSGKKEKTYDGM